MPVHTDLPVTESKDPVVAYSLPAAGTRRQDELEHLVGGRIQRDCMQAEASSLHSAVVGIDWLQGSKPPGGIQEQQEVAVVHLATEESKDLASMGPPRSLDVQPLVLLTR